jgi:hypothetical protein
MDKKKLEKLSIKKLMGMQDNKNFLKKNGFIIRTSQILLNDQFNISGGNLVVLQKVPELMLDKVYRRKLRELVFEFVLGQSCDQKRLFTQLKKIRKRIKRRMHNDC